MKYVREVFLNKNVSMNTLVNDNNDSLFIQMNYTGKYATKTRSYRLWPHKAWPRLKNLTITNL